MNRHTFLSRMGLGLGALAMLSLAATPAQPSRMVKREKPAKLFPDFESRKSDLGTIALLADVVVVEDVAGTTKKLYREECLEVGRGLLDLMSETLGKKGYAFSSRALVSVGHVVSDKARCRVLERWEQRSDDASLFPLVAPPFYQDSVLCASETARAAWHELLNGVWAFEKKKNEPASALKAITSLRDAIGAEIALVVVVVGAKRPIGKQLGQNALMGLPFAKRPKEPSFARGVDFGQFSGTGIKLAVVDCRNGDVLWSDYDYDWWGFEEARLKILTQELLKRMI